MKAILTTFNEKEYSCEDKLYQSKREGNREMKMEVDVRNHEFLDAFYKNIKWFSDMCLDEMREKIQKELDNRQYGETEK